LIGTMDTSTRPRMFLLQSLESRWLMALPTGPSPREQELLELANRLRMRPQDELPLLLESDDPDIDNALRFFSVDQTQLRQQWKELMPAPPLAWNNALGKAARGHNHRMLAAQRQSHQLPGEPELAARLAGAGYRNASFVGENVFAFAESVLHTHAGFAIDWGNGPYGIQDPPGHRDNLMSGLFREVGISMIDAPAGKNVGPYLVTQNFGARRNQGNSFVVGVLYDDRNGDRTFNAGEGIGGATVIAAGAAGTFSTASWAAGGYQLHLPPGTYTLIASGAGRRGIATIGNVTVKDDNVKRDFRGEMFRADTSAPSARLVAADVTSGAAPGTYTFSVTYTDDAAISFTRLGDGDVRVTGPNGFSQLATFVSMDRTENGLSRTATYRITAPGGFFDGADNGRYTVWQQANQVLDTNGNPAPAKAIGSFNVNTPLATFLANGTYILNGTAGHDAISLSLNGDTLVGRVNNFIYTFNYKQVKRIFVSGLGGNDRIALAREVLGSVIDGGAGNDTLRGGNGDDTFRGGIGADNISGGRGMDRAQRDKADTLSGVEALFA
jgi:Ca2+-binding RTX toxin-like protein